MEGSDDRVYAAERIMKKRIRRVWILNNPISYLQIHTIRVKIDENIVKIS
jgi:hypothetical protein